MSNYFDESSDEFQRIQRVASQGPDWLDEQVENEFQDTQDFEDNVSEGNQPEEDN